MRKWLPLLPLAVLVSACAHPASPVVTAPASQPVLPVDFAHCHSRLWEQPCDRLTLYCECTSESYTR